MVTETAFQRRKFAHQPSNFLSDGYFAWHVQ